MVFKMVKGLIGRKLNISQTFDNYGRVVPATKIKVLPNAVVQVKQVESDKYKSAQLGYGIAKKTTKPTTGHAKKAGLDIVPRYLREVGFEGEVRPGEQITLDQVFRIGQVVDISGLSKGKGFAGVVKRWGFAGGPRTHGQSDRERAPGSIGATTTPGRVYKGMKMAGHMGNRQVTIKGLEVIELNKDESELLVKGSVPGAFGGLLLIQKSGKKAKTYHEPEIPVAPQVGGEKEIAGKEEESKEEPKVENSGEVKQDEVQEQRHMESKKGKTDKKQKND
jgi:large subunit ribosomal protein L3